MYILKTRSQKNKFRDWISTIHREPRIIYTLEDYNPPLAVQSSSVYIDFS